MIPAIIAALLAAAAPAVVVGEQPPIAVVEGAVDDVPLEPLEPAPEWLPVWTLQVDPLTTFLGYEHIQIERVLGCSGSAYAGPHLRLFSPPGGDVEPYIGLGAELGGRWFPWAKAPTGPWLGVRGVGAWLFTLDDSAEPTVGGYASVLGGYTWVIADHYVLSGGAGVQYLHYKIGDYGVEGLFPALHTAVGFAF